MYAFDRQAARTVSAGVVDVARWEQFRSAEAMPFDAMWYSVPPRQSSPRDRHPEAELSLVVTGTACVETPGGTVAIDAGSAFLLDADEPHIVHNPSDAPLVVFSAYWLVDQPIPVPAVAGV